MEVPLASFFLKKLLHMGCDLHDLPSLDAELYKSLLFLRDYAGDTEDLTLSFTVTDGALGQNKEVGLKGLVWDAPDCAWVTRELRVLMQPSTAQPAGGRGQV